MDHNNKINILPQLSASFMLFKFNRTKVESPVKIDVYGFNFLIEMFQLNKYFFEQWSGLCFTKDVLRKNVLLAEVDDLVK